MNTRVFHRAAGLTIVSDRRVPGLGTPTAPGPQDVSLHFVTAAPWPDLGIAPFYTSDHTDSTGRPVVAVTRSPFGFHFEYADGTEVWIDHAARKVGCAWPEAATLEDAATYITGPILGFVLRLRGALALHASAISIRGTAVVLVGPHGAGKSTGAAALGRRGWPVIADDVLHLRPAGGQWVAEPFAGHLRLWPAGAALALGADTQLPRLTPTWDKLALDLSTHGFTAAADAVPVGTILFLDSRESSSDAPRLEPLTFSDSLVRLAAHSSASHLLDAEQRAAEFDALAHLARCVPSLRAIASDRDERFDRFIDLVQDSAALHTASPRG